MNESVPLGFFMARHGPVAAPVKHSKEDSAAVQKLKTVLPCMVQYAPRARPSIQDVKAVLDEVEGGIFNHSIP